jgi:signal transduction histidine kinase
MREVVADAKARRPAAELVELAEELRSPLTVILNAAHLLAVSRDDATAERVRRIVVRQVECLAGLVDELGEVLRADRSGGWGNDGQSRTAREPSNRGREGPAVRAGTLGKGRRPAP